jgi:hypothetical protein
MSRHLLSVIVAFAFFVLFAPCPTLAQYMYLDSNGDGVHTAADVLNGTGQTQVQIWLNTNHRRDGTEVACVTADAPLNLMGSFTAVLRTSGGTFACSNPVSLQPLMSTPYVITAGSTEFHVGYFGLAFLGTGLFPLTRFTVTVTSGTPSIGIVPTATTLGTFPLITSFGSNCGGLQFDNTMKLGAEWSDVDGLAYDSGGTAGAAPVIPALAPFQTTIGQFVSRDVTITDADGELVPAGIQGGPTFLFYASRSSAPGSSLGRIQVQPRRGDEGTYDATLTASDGQNQSAQPFHVEVAPGPNHLPIPTSLSRIDVVAGTIAQRSLWASDSDGDPMTFTKLSGPDYAEVATLRSGRGGAGGRLTLRPTLCDVGDAQIVVAVSDGWGTTSWPIPVRIYAPQPAPQNPLRTASTGDYLNDVVPGDFNEDGHVDAITADGGTHAMTLLTGDGTGALTVVQVVNLGGSRSSVAAGDFNHDGHLDAAVGAYDAAPLKVLYGRGDGTFSDPVTFAEVIQTRRLTVVDLNLDGVDDLVVTGGAETSFALLGSAAGLSLMDRLQGLFTIAGVAVGDWDGDGLSDLAASGPFPDEVSILSGRGDGTFTNRRDFEFVNLANAIVTADWNRDGRMDLASVDESFGTVRRFLADGAGGFTISDIHQFGYFTISDMQAMDWNADGFQDLVFCSEGAPASTILMGTADGSFVAAALNPNLGYSQNARSADFNEDGRPDLLGCGGSEVRVVLNPNTTPTGVLARVFTATGKMITVVPSSRTLDVYLEPSNAAFTAQDIDPTSIRMVSDGTGSISSIAAFVGKGTKIDDTDHNGMPELEATFRMEDVANLFDGIHGKAAVPVRVQASLLDTRRLCAPLTLTMYVTGGGSLAARIEPNPLNPQGTLKFSVRKAGPISVRLFDVKGRLVKTLWDRRNTQPGDQELAIDGRMPSGQPMSTGVYFYRIEMDGTSTSGRFAILK